MNVDMNTVLAILGAVLGASAHVFWWVFKSHVINDSKVHEDFRQFQLHVVENYASRQQISEFRAEMVEYLRRIEDEVKNKADK